MLKEPRKYIISLFLTGKCDHCRAYSFMSKTEKLRQISLFHRRQKTTGPPKEASFVCADASCGKGFTSAASLSRHKKSTGHKKATERRLPSVKKTAKRQLKDAKLHSTNPTASRKTRRKKSAMQNHVASMLTSKPRVLFGFSVTNVKIGFIYFALI